MLMANSTWRDSMIDHRELPWCSSRGKTSEKDAYVERINRVF